MSIALVVVIGSSSTGSAEQGVSGRDAAVRQRFTHDANVDLESSPAAESKQTATEAPAAFDNVTNGFRPAGAAVRNADGSQCDAQSCRECHQNIVTGGASHVTVQRAGHVTKGQFFESQALRVESPARQHAVVRRGRVSQRDGHHESASAR